MGNLSPTLAVRNMKETIEFYTNSLGFKMGMAFPDASNPEYVELSKDGMVLMFIPAGSLGISSEEMLGTGLNLYLQIDGNIDKYYMELKKVGVKITADIKDESFGVRDFSIEDVNGYKLTFNQILGGRSDCDSYLTNCLSCGMPMTTPQDFGGKNQANPYCVHCSNEDGSLKSWDEVVEGMVNFIVVSQDVSREVAEDAAKKYMSQMPAWNQD